MPRTWYTALGLRDEYVDDPADRGHLWGGISSVFSTSALRADGPSA